MFWGLKVFSLRATTSDLEVAHLLCLMLQKLLRVEGVQSEDMNEHLFAWTVCFHVYLGVNG